mmetsp:Transcript_5740/g.4924  ORF Transcript_5740/g.4924 Transcript_5740/m.4924 type:complete len:80 (+) Transcript_5740:967-1206(+)
MKRIFEMMKSMKDEYESFGYIEIEKYSRRFRKINKNYLEEEFEGMIDYKDFETIIDESGSGSKRYFEIIDEDCILTEDE